MHMLSTVYPERGVWYICKSLSLFPESTTIGEINGLTGFLDVSDGKKSACSSGDLGSIPG